MAKYHYAALAELAHQLKLSPLRLRLRQLDAAEFLADLVEPEKSYPYEFVCHQITGYRPKSDLQPKPLSGRLLVEDLVQLVEDLSAANPIPVGLTGTWSTTEELATRLKVSTKTICRWRRRGLPGCKLRYPDNTIRLAFNEPCIRRFVAKHLDMVKRGAAFSQLSAKEKQLIITAAREVLAERRVRLHELSQIIATKVGRAVETVRYTLRRHDEAHPENPIFGKDHQPVIQPELQAIYDLVASGKQPTEVGKRFGKPAKTIHAIVREVRARQLKARDIQYVYHEEYEAPGAEETILAAAHAPVVDRSAPRPPSDLPPYLQELYRSPLLSAEQERALFRKYNYLKFKADRMRAAIDPLNAEDEQLDAVDAVLADADRLRNEILQSNLRLVVSIARRHVGRSPYFFEIVSDGNLALMRAVEKFDYARGFKFSTYASWAIMRNYARSIPEQMYEAARLVTGNEELLAVKPSREPEVASDSVLDGVRHLIHKGLNLLSSREREVVVRHYGLDNEGQAMTLDQIGQAIGVTKERVRQIERKAIKKLQLGLAEHEAELAPD